VVHGTLEAGDKRREGRIRRFAPSSPFSKALLRFTGDRAGSWRLLWDLLGNLCPDGAQQPRHPRTRTGALSSPITDLQLLHSPAATFGCARAHQLSRRLYSSSDRVP